MASLPYRPAHRPVPERISTPNARASIEILPAELVLQIFREVDHEDIQSFACCCPHVWNTVKNEKNFEVHKRRRRYYTVRLGSLDNKPGSRNRPVDILWDIVNDDGLAIYPKRLIIGLLPLGRHGEELEPCPPFIAEQVNKLRSMVENSRDVPPDRWYTGVTSDKRPIVITNLLLCLLPNIRVLELHNYMWDFFTLQILAQIVSASRPKRSTTEPSRTEPGEREEDKCDSTRPHALSSLTEVSVYLDRPDPQDFVEVLNWALLPSVRSIRGKGLHSMKERDWGLGNFGIRGYQSNMTSLELEECMVCEGDFEILLSYTKALKHFKYHHGTPNTPEGHHQVKMLGTEEWKPRGIIEILSAYASHSLVSLDLTRSIHPQRSSGSGLLTRVFVGSLRRFHLLRKLRADIMIFVELNLENLVTKHAHMYREESTPERVERIIKLGIPVVAQARPLVDLLPAALEELSLCLTHGSGKWEVEDLFKEAQQLKAQRLPNLTKIVMEGEHETRLISDKTIRIWKNCGAQIYWQIPFTVS